MTRSPWQVGELWGRRVAWLLLISGWLTACASPPPQPHAHDPLTWMAAIGRLDDDRDDSTCSATLVAPDVIATASHCVILDGRKIEASNLVFSPNLGAAPVPPVRGVKVIAIGRDDKDPNRDDNLNVAADWALVRVTPAVTAVAPIAVGRFTAAEIDDALAKGGNLWQGGYGVYGLSAGQHLYQQGHCQRLNDDKMPEELRDHILFSSCRPIKGDSGGPLILTKANGDRYLVGVISKIYSSKDSAKERFTAAAGALGFVQEIAGTP